jgi:xylulokinase
MPQGEGSRVYHMNREERGQPESPVTIGLVLGARTITGCAFTLDGRAIATASAPLPVRAPRPGWLSIRPAEIWDEAARVIREIVIRIERPERITGIATAGRGDTGVLLDATGEPVTESIAGLDDRAEPQLVWLIGRAGAERLARITGLAPRPSLGLCRLLWHRDQEPDAFARAKRWLYLADFIAYRLCGVPATDWSLASRMLAFDLRARRWSDELLDAAGIAPALLAPAVQSGAPIGTVRRAAADATGLPAGCAVATGGHDLACAALAAGVTRHGALLDALDDPETILMSIDHPVDDLASARAGFDQCAHVAPGMFTISAPVRWFGEQTNWLGTEHDPAPVATIDDWFGNPLEAWDSTAGLVARERIDDMAALAGRQREPEITVVGSGTDADERLRTRAAAMRATLRVPDLPYPAALGAAMLAAIGAGLYIDVADALRQVRYATRLISPDQAQIGADRDQDGPA